MKKGSERLILITTITMLAALACSLSGVPEPSTDPNWPQTAAAQTWSAMEISAALSATATFPSSPTVNTPTPKSTSTSTTTPTVTQTPIPVITQLPTATSTVAPSITPFPSPTYYIWGGGGGGGSGGGGGGGGPALPCYAAQLIRDVTIPNGTALSPGTVFTKIWRIKNVGGCTWEAGSRLVAIASNFRNETPEIIERRVRPGQSIDLGVTLDTPNHTGTYSGRFLLEVERRIQVGDGSNNDTFNVRINAIAGGGVVFDFASRPCTANWENGSNRSLNCPGNRGSDSGFVRQPSSTELEDGRTYSQALWTHPQIREGGSIIGAFPALLIQNGDQLRIRVGCISGFTRCRVVYDVFYQTLEGDRTRLIPTHTEIYDGTLTTLIDRPIDTPGFLNQYISFSFKVTAISHPQEAAAAWVVMEVYR